MRSRRWFPRAAAVFAAAAALSTVAVAPPAGAILPPSLPQNFSLAIFAGTGSAGAPTAGAATSSNLDSPNGVAVDSSGNVYIADYNNQRIEKVTIGGTLSVIAGTGSHGAPTAGPATSSKLYDPCGVAVDSSGNLFIGDADNNRVEKVTSEGTLSVFKSSLKYPCGVAVDSSGNVYVAVWDGFNVVKVSADGTSTTTIAGTGTKGAPTAGTAIYSQIGVPQAVAVDSTGNVYIADGYNNVIEKVTPAGWLSVFAGTGTSGTPTAGPATSSKISNPMGVAVDSSDNVYFTSYNGYVLRATPGGTLSILGGNGGYDSTVAGPATQTSIQNPIGIAVDSRESDNPIIYVASQNQVHKLTVATSNPPAAPTSLVATPGDGSASIAFTAGANGGVAITKYQYQVGSGSWVDTVGTASPISISGLTNGTNYSIKLRAVNSAGNGAASDAVSVTPRTTPAAPTGLVATPGNGSASIAFTAGADGGAAITKYQYKVGSGSWTDAVGTTSPISISGLTNYTTYDISLRAVNSAGNGAASVSSVSVTPAGAAPSTCRNTVLGSSRLQLCWNLLTPRAGTVVLYRAEVFRRGTFTFVATCQGKATDTSCLIKDKVRLAAGTTYDVRVRAFIRIGRLRTVWSLYSDAVQITTASR